MQHKSFITVFTRASTGLYLDAQNLQLLQVHEERSEAQNIKHMHHPP